jgi:membrane protease YdiL (CAAX protease family)
MAFPALGAPPSGAGAPVPAIPGAVLAQATWGIGWFDAVTLLAAAGVLVLLWKKDIIRPGSFTHIGQRDLSGMPALIWFCSGAMMFFAPALGVGIAMALPARLVGTDPSNRFTATTSLAGYAVGYATAAFLLYLLTPRAAPGSGLRARWGDVPRGLVALVLVAPILLVVGAASVIVTTLITGHAPQAINHETLQKIVDEPGSPWSWALVAAAVLGAPVVEELTFRVFLQSAVLRVTGRTWTSILITATIFTSVHAGVAEWHTFPVLLTLGVALGVAYERTRRLGVPIVMHAVFNLLNVLLAMGMRG